MERAASACFHWLTSRFTKQNEYAIFCGTGNNGGDGLAIARLLLQAGHTVSVYILQGEKSSEDFTVNYGRLKPLTDNLRFIDTNNLPTISPGTFVIDALFGTGLSRQLQGVAEVLVAWLNQSCKTIISIDTPSGLFPDTVTEGNAVIRASHTLSFQTNKLSFMIAENNKFLGDVHLLDIRLHPDFYDNTPTLFNTVDAELICSIYKPRNQFLHKYNLGHALLYTGSKNMMGAAILCAKACLRSGAGLVTVFTEDSTQAVLQTALPEAITSTDYDFERLSHKKSAIGIGPGLALSGANKDLLWNLIAADASPLVIDASALQLLSADTLVLKKRVLNPAILTPHTGEFEKLFDKTSNDFERMKTALHHSAELNCYIILKGHHTLIACPDGAAFFNTTGNAGMATAGSGDVLTGILTGLLAQGYPQKEACLLGVYLHGVAGDIAAENLSQEAMIAGDIIECTGEAYKQISALCEEQNATTDHEKSIAFN